MTQPRIVVTGATGFVGCCLVEALVGAGGFDVVASSRRLHAGGRVARHGIQLHAADLSRRADADGLVQAADAVVHCAFGGDSDQDAATNVLLDACAAARVRSFVHLSTTEAYARQAGTVNEDAPLRSVGAAYGDIKGRIDATMRASAHRFESMVVLRPAIIYGPLSDTWTVLPIQRLLAGWYPPPGALQGTGNFVHIADLCRIIGQMLIRPQAGLRVYNVVGPELVTWFDYFGRLARALGVELPVHDVSSGEKAELGAARTALRVLPKPVRRALVALVSALPSGAGRLDRLRRANTLQPGATEAELYMRTVRYSTERLERDGFKTHVNLDEGLRQSADWARQMGLT